MRPRRHVRLVANGQSGRAKVGIGTAIAVVAVLRATALQPLTGLRQAHRARRVAVKIRAARNGNRRKRVNRAKHVKPASRVNRVVGVKHVRAASRVKHAKVANRANRARRVKAVSRAKCASLGSRVNRVRIVANAVVNARRNVLKPPIAVNDVNVGNVRNGANAASHSRKPPSKR